MKFKLKDLWSNTFIKTYLLILIPISISIIFSIYITFVYNRYYTSLLKNTYSFRLESIFNENEATTQTVIQAIRALENNEIFMKAAGVSAESASAHDISDSIYTMRNILEANPYIYSIAVINRSENSVYSTNGNTDIENYFYTECNYENYSIDYWRAYQQPLSEFQTLSPTLIRDYNTQTSVIPIVFSQIGSTKIPRLLIVNISLPQVLAAAQEQAITDNSLFLLLNKQTGQIFDAVTPTLSSTVTSDLFDRITSDSYSFFDYSTTGGKRHLVISYSASRSMLGYSFAVMVPYSDISTQMLQFQRIVVLLVILAIILTLLLAYFSTRQIYNPIQSIASLFGKHSSTKRSGDIIGYISSSVLEVLNSNKNLMQECSKTLPIAQEHYLVGLLNSTDYYSTLPEVQLDFKYNYFSAIVIKIRPTDAFFDNFTNLEYNSIQAGLYNVLQSAFEEKYDTYTIPSEIDTLYILLNPMDDMQMPQIQKITDEFKANLEADKELITLYIGIGGIYPDIDGLKKSHAEAMNKVASISGLNQIKIQSYGTAAANSPAYSFSLADENLLLNYCLTNSFDRAKELIENINRENANNSIPEKSVIQLYVHILNVIFRAMRAKNIDYDSDMKGDFGIISDIISLPTAEIYKTIFTLIDDIESHMQKLNRTVDIGAVTAYIKEHFTEEISRESIAEALDITPKYLSKIIKDELGMNFVAYIANLRMEKAKTLLLETDKTITEIYEETGFNNRNTFIRTFKKEVGVTPSEFRNNGNQ